jgi:hypothetical protein
MTEPPQDPEGSFWSYRVLWREREPELITASGYRREEDAHVFRFDTPGRNIECNDFRSPKSSKSDRGQ